MLGPSRWGAPAHASANFDENSPNTRCWLHCSTSPNVAASQNTVVPPLPSTISQPSGSENSSANPERTEPTSALTWGLRWEVPMIEVEAATTASICAGRTFEGPQPKRPSTGRIDAGSRMS